MTTKNVTGYLIHPSLQPLILSFILDHKSKIIKNLQSLPANCFSLQTKNSGPARSRTRVSLGLMNKGSVAFR